jgi:FHA domain
VHGAPEDAPLAEQATRPCVASRTRRHSQRCVRRRREDPTFREALTVACVCVCVALQVEDFLFEGGPGLELGQHGTERSHRPATRQARHRDTAVLASLERSVRASSDRAMGNALAVLRGMKARFLLTKPEVLLGRCTDDQHVDIDLSLEGNASKVSRQHAFISQRKDGTFCVRNVGRRPLTVNGATVDIGQRVRLPHDSVLEIGGLRLMFIANRRRQRQQPAAGPHTPIPQSVPHVQPQPPAAEAQP